MTDLLTAVDRLTKPEHQHIAQKDDTGRWLKAHTVTHPPLLQRMHEAVHPSSNRTAGSASSASTRSPIDLDALFEYAKMTAQIRDWCRIEHIPPHRDPVTALRQWYVARLIHPGDDTWHIRQLTGWARIIRDHLNPPERFTVKAPCPCCLVTGYGDEINGGDTWPIEVRYRLTDDGRMVDHIAFCRACGTTWVGKEAVIELADEIEEKAASEAIMGSDPEECVNTQPGA